MSSAANLAMLKMISGESDSNPVAAILIVCMLCSVASIATGITAYYTDDLLKDLIIKVPGPGPSPSS